MKVLSKCKKLLTNGEFLDILNQSNIPSSKAKSKLINFCAESLNTEQCQFLRMKLAEFDLFEFEIVNLINIKPKGLIHLQLVIEEMSERFTEEQMNQILSLFTQ